MNRILFTGAGFSKNFGGPLANEFINYPLSNFGEDQSIRSKWNEYDNFEEAYVNIMEGVFSIEQKKIVHEAVMNAYQELIKCFNINNGQSINNFYKHLIEPLCNNNDGWFFTLNQDLFIERNIFIRNIIINPMIPGVNYIMNRNEEFQSVSIETSAKDNAERAISQLNKKMNNLLYIKIHGSSNWFKKENNSEILIIGADKKSSIQNEPLLQYYLELFEGKICENNVKMLVIGYGFNDEHINTLLKKAHQEYDLKIYFMYHNDKIKNRARNLGLDWKGFYKFSDVFPKESFDSPYEQERFKGEFFEDN